MAKVILTARTANGEHVYTITQPDNREARHYVSNMKSNMYKSAERGMGIITINDDTLGEVLFNVPTYHAVIITIEED